MLAIVALAWFAVGMLAGFFIAINRIVNSPDLASKIEDLREIKYEAERAKTLFHLAKMLERVNRSLLEDLLKQVDKDLKAKHNARQNEKHNTTN